MAGRRQEARDAAPSRVAPACVWCSKPNISAIGCKLEIGRAARFHAST
jgi:hypothetical protein